MKLSDIIIYNRAPFEYYSLHLEPNDSILVFNGINGAGKTTILSYIVDSMYELAKKGFTNQFDLIHNQFYRISTNSFSLDSTKPSFVYLRFNTIDDTIPVSYIDYVDVRSIIDEVIYYDNLNLENPIAYADILGSLKAEGLVKQWSIKDKEQIDKLFNSNILTYFPAYRYELPSYLNTPYKMDFEFNLHNRFAGYLPNPIEVTSDLQSIANWIMDVVLDNQIYKEEDTLMTNLRKVFTAVLFPKLKIPVRLGIGKRGYGASRISIMSAQEENVRLYPSIFYMSSGELALTCLFCELLKQADCISITEKLNGIVLVDEIDKHLHVALQKQVLPHLIEMFPGVQFILTTHSPFISLGLADEHIDFTNIDFDQGGIPCPYDSNEMYSEVYEMIINKNNNYKNQYEALTRKLKELEKPTVITEGKTDWKHLKKALSIIQPDNLDIALYECDDNLGDTALLAMLRNYSRIPNSKPVIGVFDRDNFKNLKIDGLDEKEFVEFGNNVFAFAIPSANADIYGDEISIEHYYCLENLKKEHDGRRLFLGDEFFSTGFGKSDSTLFTRCKQIQNKASTNGIIDEKVYRIDTDPQCEKSIALSKSDFANLVLYDELFAAEFDFDNFKLIFDVIKNIIDQ